MKIGTIILNREVTTQAGKVSSKPGHRLMSVFLGSVKDGEEPDPQRSMHTLGYRQMAMFETSVRIASEEVVEWRLVFSCLGAIDAVEAAIRFAHKIVADEFKRSKPNTSAPYLHAITVGTMKVGPIADDGTPHNGRGPAFFGWKHGASVTLDEHLKALRIEAKKHAS